MSYLTTVKEKIEKCLLLLVDLNSNIPFPTFPIIFLILTTWRDIKIRMIQFFLIICSAILNTNLEIKKDVLTSVYNFKMEFIVPENFEIEFSNLKNMKFSYLLTLISFLIFIIVLILISILIKIGENTNTKFFLFFGVLLSLSTTALVNALFPTSCILRVLSVISQFVMLKFVFEIRMVRKAIEDLKKNL